MIATDAWAVDINATFMVAPSPACPGAQVVDRLASVCEIDPTNIPKGICNQTVSQHKFVQFAACPLIVNNVVPGPEPTDAKGRLLRYLIAGVRVAFTPPLPDISLSGPYMSENCAEAATAIQSRSYGPGWFAAMDKDFPQWRACLTQHAEAIHAALPTHPYVVSVSRLQSILERIDLGKPAHSAKVKAFVAALDKEPVRPTADRVAEMLGDSWN